MPGLKKKYTHAASIWLVWHFLVMLMCVFHQAKADLNMPEPDIGVTPLIAAANAGHLDVCKVLMLGWFAEIQRVVQGNWAKDLQTKARSSKQQFCWFADVCWKIYSPWSAIQIVEVLGWLLKGAFWGQNWIHHLSTFAHILDRHCFPA